MKRITFFAFALLSAAAQLSAQIWTQKATYGGPARYHAAGFSIGTKGYIGTGNTSGSGNYFVQDFWEYDQATDSWTQKANHPGTPMYLGVGFAIGNKGYIGLGHIGGNQNTGTMYEYDPSANTWTQKASMQAGRNASSAFVAGGKAYIVGGVIVGFNNSATNELWEFDPVADTWTQRAAFPGGPRGRGNAFGINGKGYYGLGHDASMTNYSDFWMYDPLTDTWTQKTSFPDARRTAMDFTIGNSAFIGGGYASGIVSTFYEYNTIADTWTQRPDFPPLPKRWAGTGFGIGNKGYMGLGRDASTTTYAEWYEYAPLDPKNSIGEVIVGGFTVSPNPSYEEAVIKLDKVQDVLISIYASSGQLVKSVKLTGSDRYTIAVSDLAKGIYSIYVQGDQLMVQKMIKL